MISLNKKSDCCGCNACVQRCPKQCIIMHEDVEGFLYPQIDVTTCIDCGLCEVVCPVLNQNEPKRPLQVFAAKNNNEDQRLHSSSGGIFILLAEQTIKQGGVVFGARFDKCWEVEHSYAETLEDLEPLMRSKYVQSRIGNNYKEAERFLKLGRLVLFVGTSCQIAGLHKFLRKDYDNLLAVDFICHGVPSPGVWRRYLEEIKNERSEAIGQSTVLCSSLKTMFELTGINFREKQPDYDWAKFGFVIRGKSLSKGDQNSVLWSSVASDNSYMKGFFADLYLRPSCHACPVKKGKGSADITIGDFWKIWQYHPEFHDKIGVSMILCNTHKGQIAFNDLEGLVKLSSVYNVAVQANSVLVLSIGEPSKRKDFYKMFNRGDKKIEEIVTPLATRSLFDKIKGRILIPLNLYFNYY